MKILRAKLTTVSHPDLPGRRTVTPLLPRSFHGQWSQGSGLWRPRGESVVVVQSATDEDLRAAERLGCVYLGEVAKAETPRMLRAFGEVSPAFAPFRQAGEDEDAKLYRALGGMVYGHHVNVLGEWTAAYREFVAPLELALAQRETGRRISEAVAVGGASIAVVAAALGMSDVLVAVGGASWLLGMLARGAFGPVDRALLAALIASHSFSNKDDGSVGTMDARLGGSAHSFTIPTGSVINQAGSDNHGASDSRGEAYDSTMSASDVQVTSIVLKSGNCGPTNRVGSTGQWYLAYSAGGLQRDYGGTTLGTGTAAAVGDTIGIYSTGTSHSSYLNGAVNVSPVTDATYATGKQGLLGVTGAFKNWIAYDALPTDGIGAATAVGDTGSSTTLTSPAHRLTAGSLNLVGIRYWRNAAQDVSSVADTAGNTYTHIATVDQSGDRIAYYYAKNCTGHTANVVTVTLSAAAVYRVIGTVELWGMDTSAPLDTSATGGTGGATSVTSGSFTTASADEWIVAWSQAANVGNNWTPATNYASAVEDTDASTLQICMFQVRRVTATQSGVTVAATTGGATSKSIIVGTFKVASGGGGTVVPALDGEMLTGGLCEMGGGL